MKLLINEKKKVLKERKVFIIIYVVRFLGCEEFSNRDILSEVPKEVKL